MNTALDNDPSSTSNVLFTYTRAQAVVDGVLVDLSSSFPSDTRMFKWNLCCTESVWALIENTAKTEDLDCPDVYVWDLAFMAFTAIRTQSNTGSEHLFFKITLPLCENGTEHRLKLVCGPGDAGEPVLTIMLINED